MHHTILKRGTESVLDLKILINHQILTLVQGPLCQANKMCNKQQGRSRTVVAYTAGPLN